MCIIIIIIIIIGDKCGRDSCKQKFKIVALSGTLAVTNTCPGCSEGLRLIICALSSKHYSLVNWHYPTSPTGNVDDQSMMFWRTCICKHTSLYSLCYFSSPTSISQAARSISYLTTLQDLCTCGVQIISLPPHWKRFWVPAYRRLLSRKSS
jgi:hypothetical protein